MPSKVTISDAYQPVIVGSAYLVKGLLHRLRVKEIIDQVLPYQPDIATTCGALAQVLIANRMTFQQRIAGLTLLIMIAVLAASLLEQQVRRWIAKTGKRLTGLRPEKRDDAYPTAKALLEVFATYAVVIVRGQRGREKLWHLSALNPLQKKIRDILGLPALQTLAEG